MRGPQPAKTSEFGMPCTSRLDRRSPASSAGTSVTFLGWFSTGWVLFCNQLAMRRPHRVFHRSARARARRTTMQTLYLC